MWVYSIEKRLMKKRACTGRISALLTRVTASSNAISTIVDL